MGSYIRRVADVGTVGWPVQKPDQPFANEILRRLPRNAADFLRQLQDALLNVSRPAKRSRRAKPIRIYEKGIAFRRGGLYR